MVYLRIAGVYHDAYVMTGIVFLVYRISVVKRIKPYLVLDVTRYGARLVLQIDQNLANICLYGDIQCADNRRIKRREVDASNALAVYAAYARKHKCAFKSLEVALLGEIRLKYLAVHLMLGKRDTRTNEISERRIYRIVIAKSNSCDRPCKLRQLALVVYTLAQIYISNVILVKLLPILDIQVFQRPPIVYLVSATFDLADVVERISAVQ